ncbi:hypothetical protein [Zunongwangia pacifica]|uniref:Lipoprotein n=1 Tax=Zunongwangia pacifica TaxID=2911062 RepID=A0A9X1ZYG1_9FLAO|nr:hypothetical protein [Zunongwangia pacifica]MCL6220013.1 hypothetical protein [Zunongwangia pacifica]
MKKLLLLCLLTCLSLSCSNDDDSTNFRYEPYNLSLGSLSNCSMLEVACPSGVTCDENYSYRAYSYSDEDFQIYISFDTDIINNFSEESIRENFNYMNFVFRFPEHSNENVSYYYSTLNPIRTLNETTGEGANFRINSFENGVLNVTLFGYTNKISKTTISDDADCYSGDVGGMCAETIDADIKYSIDLSFCFE